MCKCQSPHTQNNSANSMTKLFHDAEPIYFSKDWKSWQGEKLSRKKLLIDAKNHNLRVIYFSISAIYAQNFY